MQNRRQVGVCFDVLISLSQIVRNRFILCPFSKIYISTLLKPNPTGFYTGCTVIHSRRVDVLYDPVSKARRSWGLSPHRWSLSSGGQIPVTFVILTPSVILVMGSEKTERLCGKTVSLPCRTLLLLLGQFSSICFLPNYGNATFLLMNHLPH